MSSKNHFPEYQFSKFSERRQKIDAQYIENGADRISSLKKENSLEYDSHNGYRESLDWDSAFFTSPGILEPEELFHTLNFRPSKPSEQERKNSICQDDSRGSLAWDNAFFTSAGVLDPEELSLVNKGYKGSGRYLVPNADDKIRRPAESYAAINSNGFSLASLEIELFDDLKASFNSRKTSDTANSSSKKSRDLKKTDDASSRVKMKSMPASKRQNLNINGSERTSRLSPFPSQAQNVARGGNCNPLSSLKPPNVLAQPQVNSPSTCLSKRAALGLKHTRTENKATKAASGQHMNVAKRPCLAESSSKSPSKDSLTPSNPTCISILGSRLSGSSSALGNLPGNKIDQLNSSLPCHLLSSLNCFYISPASSVDISSDKSTKDLCTTPCKETCSETSLYNECCLRHEHQETRFQNQPVNIKEKGSNSILPNVSRNIKPSGLRIPSPKIGFFDAENSMALTPNKELKFHLGAHSSSKTGRVDGSNKGTANRTILSKLQQTETGDTKLDSERNRVLCPSGIRNSDPAPLKEENGSQGFLTNRKGMKNEGQDTRKAKKQRDSRNNEKENLCSFHNQLDGLTNRMEAIDFIRELQ